MPFPFVTKQVRYLSSLRSGVALEAMSTSKSHVTAFRSAGFKRKVRCYDLVKGRWRHGKAYYVLLGHYRASGKRLVAFSRSYSNYHVIC